MISPTAPIPARSLRATDYSPRSIRCLPPSRRADHETIVSANFMGSVSIRSRCWLAISLLLTGCSGPYSSPTVAAKTAGKPTPVRVFEISLETIPEIITATGELSAEDTATISAKVAGRVEKLNVDLGSVVEQGQVLAELEKDDYNVKVKQAEALVEQTRARLGLSQGSGDQVDPLETSAVKQAAASLKEAKLI